MMKCGCVMAWRTMASACARWLPVRLAFHCPRPHTRFLISREFTSPKLYLDVVESPSSASMSQCQGEKIRQHMPLSPSPPPPSPLPPTSASSGKCSIKEALHHYPLAWAVYLQDSTLEITISRRGSAL